MRYPNDARQAGNYTRGGNANEYTFVSGLCVLPLAEDPPTDPAELADWSPVVVVRLHAPYRIRNFSTLVEKEKNPPPLPAPQDTGAFVFLGGSITIVTNFDNTFRNYTWDAAASLQFVENCVSRPQDGLVLGTLPYAETVNRENVVNYGTSLHPLVEGQVTYTPSGALKQAGAPVKAGHNMGVAIVSNPVTGELVNNGWGYNNATFYPGVLFYSDLPNGGPTAAG